MKPSAKIILDSISPDGARLTTMEVVMHRFVLAEFNTHRVFSRNSASSRAIPYSKMHARVDSDPAMPIYWGKNQSGMQAKEELHEAGKVGCMEDWQNAKDSALHFAGILTSWGLHKQLTNRLVEPFMWHTVIVTATDWGNFFNQRCHEDAQPEMKAAADAMQLAYYSSTPKLVQIGQWHTPYLKEEDYGGSLLNMEPGEAVEALKEISVARCARVSYLTHDGRRDIEEDLKLFGKLKESMHLSPFEHVATPCEDYHWISGVNRSSYRKLDTQLTCKLTGNFTGWHQYRKFLEGENRSAFIPNHSELNQ